MDRNPFQGYADRIDVNEFFDVMSGAENAVNLVPLLRSTVKNYVENRTLIVKEFELDLYRMPDGKYVIHICKRHGSDNYCDYYIIASVDASLKYRILRALISESTEPHDIYFEIPDHAEELRDLSEVLCLARGFAS